MSRWERIERLASKMGDVIVGSLAILSRVANSECIFLSSSLVAGSMFANPHLYDVHRIAKTKDMAHSPE